MKSNHTTWFITYIALAIVGDAILDRLIPNMWGFGVASLAWCWVCFPLAARIEGE